MESTLPPEQKATYSAIIDSILASSDINTVSTSLIRKGLQTKVDYDLAPQKQPINELILERFDKFQTQQGNGVTAVPTEPAPTANGVARPAHEHNGDAHTASGTPRASTKKRKTSEEADDSSEVDQVAPPKKAKKVKSEVETDEQIAKRIQAEFNAEGGRSTRGGGTKKKPVVKKEKKVKKKKSKAKIGSDDDSEVEGDGSDKPGRGAPNNGFNKPMNLSEPLGSLLGETALSRPQTVKRIWAYVKERDLQDPSDRRQIRCDDAMRAVFKQDSVHMFTMNKILASHLYPIEDVE